MHNCPCLPTKGGTIEQREESKRQLAAHCVSVMNCSRASSFGAVVLRHCCACCHCCLVPLSCVKTRPHSLVLGSQSQSVAGVWSPPKCEHREHCKHCALCTVRSVRQTLALAAHTLATLRPQHCSRKWPASGNKTQCQQISSHVRKPQRALSFGPQSNLIGWPQVPNQLTAN